MTQILITGEVLCDECNGIGHLSRLEPHGYESITCPWCDGTGIIETLDEEAQEVEKRSRGQS